MKGPMFDTLAEYWVIIVRIYHLYLEDLTFPLGCGWPQNYFDDGSGSRLSKLTATLKKHNVSIDEVVLAMTEAWPKAKDEISKDDEGNLRVTGDWNISHLIASLATILAKHSETQNLNERKQNE